MSVCEHNIYCPGFGPEHDFQTVGPTKLIELRGEGKTLARSGDPRKRAVGTGLRDRVQAALDYGRTQLCAFYEESSSTEGVLEMCSTHERLAPCLGVTE